MGLKTEEPAQIKPVQTLEIISPSWTSSAPPVIETEEEWPFWLANEDMLRDEGVIFGLSGAKPDEKLEIISSVFKKNISEVLAKRDELNEKIAEINLKIENKHNHLEDIKTNIKKLQNTDFKDENILRVSIGLILGLGMAAGNYFIISQALKPSFPESFQFIAWGVFLSGMFSLYNNNSIFHNEFKPTWKNLIEEIGLPLAASTFVLAFSIGKIQTFESVAYFVFTFFTFLISGKLLLGNVARLKSEFKSFSFNQKIKKELSKAEGIWKTEIEDLENQIEDFRVEKWKILPALNELEAKISKSLADKETVTHIFLSEYNLAKNYRSKLNDKDFKNILGQ